MGGRARTTRADRIDLTAGIVAAYVAGNPLPAAALGPLIVDIHAALTALSRTGPAMPPPTERSSPAQIRRSIGHDHLISFEDGRPYRTLRRHLTLRGLTPEAYRLKWGLPDDYPMTAAGYSARRSELARSSGLGQRRRKSPADREEDGVSG